jgi:hypothetical protein
MSCQQYERMNEYSPSPLPLLDLFVDEPSYVLVAGVSDDGP